MRIFRLKQAIASGSRCLAMLVVAGCAGGSAAGSPSSAVGGELTAFDQCMLDAGFKTGVYHEDGGAGYPGWYEWSTDHSPQEASRLSNECRARFRPYREKTPAELREIYDRWISERECLVRLGWKPVAPPTFEKFLEQWRTGPWMPVDGVDTGSWTYIEFREAKDACALEFFDRS